jgi:hypothetical protein
LGLAPNVIIRELPCQLHHVWLLIMAVYQPRQVNQGEVGICSMDSEHHHVTGEGQPATRACMCTTQHTLCVNWQGPLTSLCLHSPSCQGTSKHTCPSTHLTAGPCPVPASPPPQPLLGRPPLGGVHWMGPDRLPASCSTHGTTGDGCYTRGHVTSGQVGGSETVSTCPHLMATSQDQDPCPGGARLSLTSMGQRVQVPCERGRLTPQMRCTTLDFPALWSPQTTMRGVCKNIVMRKQKDTGNRWQWLLHGLAKQVGSIL